MAKLIPTVRPYIDILHLMKVSLGLGYRYHITSLKGLAYRPFIFTLILLYLQIQVCRAGEWQHLDNPRKEIFPDPKFFKSFERISISIGQTTTQGPTLPPDVQLFKDPKKSQKPLQNPPSSSDIKSRPGSSFSSSGLLGGTAGNRNTERLIPPRRPLVIPRISQEITLEGKSSTELKESPIPSEPKSLNTINNKGVPALVPNKGSSNNQLPKGQQNDQSSSSGGGTNLRKQFSSSSQNQEENNRRRQSSSSRSDRNSFTFERRKLNSNNKNSNNNRGGASGNGRKNGNKIRRVNDWRERVRIGGPDFHTITFSPVTRFEDTEDFGDNQDDNFGDNFGERVRAEFFAGAGFGRSQNNEGGGAGGADRFGEGKNQRDFLRSGTLPRDRQEVGAGFEEAFKDPFEGMVAGNNVKDVTAMCDLRTGTMDVSLTFGSLFEGEIYTKGNYKQPLCKILGNGASKEMSMRIPFRSCGVEYEKSTVKEIFAVTMIVKMEKEWPVISMFDKSYRLTCDSSFDESESTKNSTETYGVTVPMGPTEVVPTKKRISIPDTFMKVISGKDVQTSGTNLLLLGGVGTVIIISQDNTDYDLFVTECFAHDGMKMSDVDLIDPTGCPAHKKIAGFVRYNKDIEPGKTYAYFHFKIFKFPDTTNVFFSCKVQLCLNSCPRPICISPPANSDTKSKNGFRVERESLTNIKDDARSPAQIAVPKIKRSIGVIDDTLDSLPSIITHGSDRSNELSSLTNNNNRIRNMYSGGAGGGDNLTASFYKQLSNFIQVIFDDGDEKEMRHEINAEKRDKENASSRRHTLINETVFHPVPFTQPIQGHFLHDSNSVVSKSKVCFEKNFVGAMSIIIPVTFALLFFVCIYVSIRHKKDEI